MTESSNEKTKGAENNELLSTQTKSLIFISHDNRDAELAESFSKLLSSVSCGVLKSFRTSDRKGSQGIEYGVEWYPELMKNLDIASDVVCLLTQRSLDRPWILYEAGVAKGKLNTPVYGISLGIPLNRANNGPFAQFQNCDDNEESLTKLVMQLVRRIPNSEPDHDAIKMQVSIFKQKATQILKSLADNKEKKEERMAVDETSVAKLFEEVKLMFQDLPSRVEGRLSDAVDPIRRRRMRRFHPSMYHELLHMSGKDPIWFLVILGSLRDDFPWLYEVGIEVYRAMKSGNRARIDKAMNTFMKVLDLTTRGPFSEDFIDSKETYALMRDLPMIFD